MEINSYKNILVLAPHTDDGELGAGGLISRLIENGAEVHYAAFSAAEDSVPEGFSKNILRAEVYRATASLGINPENVYVFNYVVRQLNYHRQEILEDLIRLRGKHHFDLVVMPSLSDIHQDHRTIAEEGLRAFKNKTILGYELIWNNLTFNTTGFVELNRSHVEAKCRALAEYKSQESRVYMSSEFVYALAKTRGVQIGVEYAECFEVVRMIFK